MHIVRHLFMFSKTHPNVAFFPNSDFQNINCVDRFLENGVFLMRKQVIIKGRKIWRTCRPEISIDQPIAKLPQVTKGLLYGL
jgi:hypothetical protein